MEQLGEGLWRLPLARRDSQNAFLIEGEDGLTLVDSGFGRSAPRIILDAIASRWRYADLRRIVITHAHPDHVRGLNHLRATTGAAVLIHEADASWLAGGRVPAGVLPGLAGGIVARLPVMRWEPCTPDGVLRDGETLGGLEVIHTPGHTPGHAVLRHVPSNTVLVGDAVFHRRGLDAGPALFSADATERDRSLAQLPVDVAAVGFAHGPPLKGAEVDGYVAFVSGD